MRADVLLGLEVTELGIRRGQHWWRMTVDVWDARKDQIVRYQLVGPGYNGWPTGPPERAIDDLAAVQSDYSRRVEIATALDKLDREAAGRMAPIMADLRRAQAAVIYGEETVAKLEEDE